MITEEHEVPNGWPLGLENMNMRLQVTQESSLPPASTTAEPSSFRVPSSSFSSFSSSNLDTESTISFFQDNSVTLGRLIGIKLEHRRSLHYPNRVQYEGEEIIGEQELDSAACEKEESETSQGICVPLLHNIIMKRSRSKSNARL